MGPVTLGRGILLSGSPISEEEKKERKGEKEVKKMKKKGILVNQSQKEERNRKVRTFKDVLDEN